ncbi:MAG: SurA N-terminal domain-containing protein [Chitinivibrionales bacterium]
MIQQMRNNAAIIMWIVIVAFVATIVFAWGMDLTSRSRTKNIIGRVNGKEIAINYFEKMVEQEREKQREQSGGAEMSPSQSRMVPRQVWETEVNRLLLKDLFAKMKISSSSDQIYEFIKKNPPREVYSAPQFQTDSMFDTSKFIKFLNTPQVYENEGMQMLEQYTRDFSIPMQTLRILLSFQSFPSQVEVEREYRVENEKVKFEYAKINVSSFSVDSSDVPGAAIAGYYKEHADSFNSDEQADLYFVKVPKISTANDEKITYNDVLEIRKKTNNNDSLFQEEAKLESDDDATAAHGGDLGWITKGAMGPQFDSAVFSIPLNTVSMPIRTQSGFHLIFVENRSTKDGKEQAKALQILRKVAPSGETMDRLNAQADSLHRLISSEGIKSVMKKSNGIAVDSTGFFKRGEVIPKIGYVSGVASFAFNHEVDDVSDIFENEDGFYIVQIKQKLKKGLMPLDIVRDRIVQTLSDSVRLKKAHRYFEDVLKKNVDKSAIASLSAKDPLITCGTTDTVSRMQFIPQVGYNNTVAAAAFALPEGKVSGLITASGAIFIVKPLWHKRLDAIPANSPEIAALRQKMESQAAEKIYLDWYLDLKSRADVVDNLKQFYMD